MIGENWDNEQKRRLREMRIDPVRSPPERLMTMIEYFRTPGESLWAVTEGKGPFHVSKELGAKVRDLVAAGALDWVLDETPAVPDQGIDVEWRRLLMSHSGEFSQGVGAYQQELGCQIQTAEILLDSRAGYMPPKVPYSSAHSPFVESIFKRNQELAELRRKFESALEVGDVAGARELRERIGSEMVDLIAI